MNSFASIPRPFVGQLGRFSARRRPRSRRAVALAALAATLFCGAAQATQLNIDTTALAGTSARLDFSLLDGDFSLGNNTFTIGSISTDGSPGAVDCSLGCVGGPPYTIDEALGFGQFLYDLTLGNTLSIAISFSRNFSGTGAPDRTTLLLLDASSNFTLVDTDLDFPIDAVPAQDALLLVDHAPGVAIQLASASFPSVPVTVAEPGATALFTLGLLLLAGQRRIHKGRPRVFMGVERALDASSTTSIQPTPGE